MTTRARPPPTPWAVRARRCSSSNRKPTSTRPPGAVRWAALIVGLIAGSGRDRGGGVVGAAQQPEHAVAIVDDGHPDDRSFSAPDVGRTAAAGNTGAAAAGNTGAAAPCDANDHPRAGNTGAAAPATDERGAPASATDVRGAAAPGGAAAVDPAAAHPDTAVRDHPGSAVRSETHTASGSRALSCLHD